MDILGYIILGWALLVFVVGIPYGIFRLLKALVHYLKQIRKKRIAKRDAYLMILGSQWIAFEKPEFWRKAYGRDRFKEVCEILAAVKNDAEAMLLLRELQSLEANF